MRGLTLKEAAVLAGVSEKSIRHALADRIVDRGRSTRRLFKPREVFYFGLLSALPVQLTPADRKRLFRVVAHRAERAGNLRWERTKLVIEGRVPGEFDTASLRDELAGRLATYRRGLRRVERRDDVGGGEPVFAGTRIPVRHVGQLVNRKVAPSELLEGYPSLSEDDLRFAGLFAALGPPPGRPRRLKVKRTRTGG